MYMACAMDARGRVYEVGPLLCPELPTVHEPLMIAPERLVVACISNCCSPPSFVNEVHIVTPQLFLHGFIKSLDPW